MRTRIYDGVMNIGYLPFSDMNTSEGQHYCTKPSQILSVNIYWAMALWFYGWDRGSEVRRLFAASLSWLAYTMWVHMNSYDVMLISMVIFSSHLWIPRNDHIEILVKRRVWTIGYTQNPMLSIITLWLFNSLPWKITMLLIGKPS